MKKMAGSHRDQSVESYYFTDGKKWLIKSHRDGWGQIDNKGSGTIPHNHILHTALHFTKYFCAPLKTVISLK